MLTLAEVLAAVQREIVAARVFSEAEASSGPSMPERLTVTLPLAFAGGNGDAVAVGVLSVASSEAESETHRGPSLTIEWRARDFARAPAGAPSLTAPSLGSNGATSHPPSKAGSSGNSASIEQRCVVAFGTPGFDNAARAEVFCELAVNLPAADLKAALELVAEGRVLSSGDPHASRVMRLRQLLSFAPVGPEMASRALLELLAENPIEAVVSVLSERWRFGTHWDLPQPPA